VSFHAIPTYDQLVFGDSTPRRSQEPVGRVSLREKIADAMRAALAAGEMRPGVVYSAPALASRFGVSATPVREALLDLAKEGLVEAVRNKGFRVSTVSAADLDEIYQLRLLLEVPGVAQLAGTADAGELAALRPAADAILAAAERGDVTGYVEADTRFHLGLLELLDNRRLVAIVRNLREQGRMYGLRPLAVRGQMAAAAREHHALLEHLAAGDAAGTEKLMRRHLAHSRRLWTPAVRPPGMPRHQHR
jgi:DNA-binding GntR family transcriptional regulator